MEPDAKRVKYGTDEPGQMQPSNVVDESTKSRGSKTITLLPAECLLREFLLEGAQEFPGLEIWVTGGWVRDRLLGIPSSDLDLALSSLTGKEFGTFLESFSARPEVETKYGQRAAELNIPGSLFSRFHITKKNPQMSKKLETAGGKLFGLVIDLVNLRKEVYDGQTRNPDMEFGTAEEDAFRRDATVNALFFDLTKQEIIDHTGRGLEDLEAKIMRTPLDPRQTFMDDPLRVLRLIRVGSKLGFSIDTEAAACMQDRQIHQALDTMITRDRVGAELTKMMRSKNTEAAFRWIFEFRLYSPIFVRLDAALLRPLATQFPGLGINSTSAWPTTWPRAYGMLAHCLGGQDKVALLVSSEANTDLLWSMAAYSPFAGLRQTLLKEAVQEATSAIKATAKVSQLLESSLRNYDSIRRIVEQVAKPNGERCSRSVCGMAIRAWGTTWSTQVTYVMLSDAVYDAEQQENRDLGDEEFSAKRYSCGKAMGKYAAFAAFIFDQDLLHAHLQRPLLNGTEIQSLFGLKGGGKYLRVAIDKLLEWQFGNVDATKDEAEAWLLGEKDALCLPCP